MAGDFSFEHSKDDHEQGLVDPQWGSRDRIQDNFLIWTISKFDIGLIKMLFCSVAIVEAKNENLITWYWLSYSAFRTSYAVATWAPITAYKLIEYLVKIHLILLKKSCLINVHIMVFKHNTFLCLQLFVVRFAATWNVAIWWTLYKEDVKSEGV